MKKLFLCTFLGVSLLLSCSSEADLSEKTVNTVNTKNYQLERNDNYELKKKFAIALHKAMIDHVAVRDFIKSEALNKFDGDYDVLYGYVSDELINGSSFRDILLLYFNSPSELEEIEAKIPALTIFVPELPEDSFSADNWDTASEIPLVAIRLLDNDKTPIISSNSQSYLLDNNIIPGFPVVVLKECERIIVPEYPLYSSNNNLEYVSSRLNFKFLHNHFDFLSPRSPETTPDPDTDRLVTAWETYGEEQNLGWHRDYIYYTINPGNPNGPFINNFSEFLKDFKIEGSTPDNAFKNISNPSSVPNGLSDPDLDNLVISYGQISQGSFWTDGKFDFDVAVDYNSEDPELHKVFDARPQDLFFIEYTEIGSFTLPVYTAQIKWQLQYPLNLNILDWRLHDYSNRWTFRVEEIDLPVEVSQSVVRQSKFNTNFSIEAEVWKVGLQLGASTENITTVNSSIKYTEQSNKLGDAIISFGDNVIIGIDTHPIPPHEEFYQLRRYSTGQTSFSLAPAKVQ